MARSRWIAPAAACAFFFLCGLIFIPYAGLETDEALFARDYYIPIVREFRMVVFHHELPLMTMSYIGSLKTLLLWPVVKLFGASLWSLRVPAVFIGCISVWFFYLLTERIAGRTAAVMGALLLATDSVFLLANTFDWGPVALEHVLTIMACYLLVKFAEAGTQRYLAAGFFLLGLALWNKAVFVWALNGLVVAAVVTIWPEIRANLSWRNARIATAAFLLGCSPLLIYNVRNRNATLRENAGVELASIPSKGLQFRLAAQGSSLFGYLALDNSEPNPKPATSTAGRFAAWVNQHAGEFRESYFYYVLGAALLGVPWWWRHRSARFALIFSVVAWLSMAATKGAGGAAHHTILLWPFPILFAVAAFRWRLWMLVLAGIVVTHLLVLNQYLLQFERYGASVIYTDALFPLTNQLGEAGDRKLYLIDWGMYDSLVALKEGKLQLRNRFDELAAETPDPVASRELRETIEDPQGWIVNHVRDKEIFPAPGARLEAIAAPLGYHKETIRTIPDSNGRPVFEIFRYTR